MVIFIIGMPGTGKRRLGKQLADTFGLEYIDTAHSSVDPNELSDSYQHSEKSTIEALDYTATSIIVTGGHAPLDADNRACFKHGKVIYLYMNADRLWEDMPPEMRVASGVSSISMLQGMCEELGDIYLKTADFLCNSDAYSEIAYQAARQYIETLGIV